MSALAAVLVAVAAQAESVPRAAQQEGAEARERPGAAAREHPIALVAEDRVALRAAPRESAAAEAMLLRGEWLEVRGEAPGFLKVYDHRRERPGFVRAGKVRLAPVDPAERRAIVRFLRGSPGMESLGIAYAALSLRGAQPAAPEVYAAIGEQATRLAARQDPHREVAEAAGARFIDVEREGRVITCYDGDAFRRVLSMPGAEDADRAGAALALTSAECVDPAAPPAAARLWSEWRLEVLDRVQTAPAQLLARVRLRRVEALGALAYAEARAGDPVKAAERAERALGELQLVDRATLSEEELPLHATAALQLSAVRWATEQPEVAPEKVAHLELRPARPGESCLRVVIGGEAQAERCTWGYVWESSLRRTPGALTAAVQLGPAWTELWIFHRARRRWTSDVIPPASSASGIGVAESAGSTADGTRLLVAREAMLRGRLSRHFELILTRSMRVVAQSSFPAGWFERSSSPSWRNRTLALR